MSSAWKGTALSLELVVLDSVVLQGPVVLFYVVLLVRERWGQ